MVSQITLGNVFQENGKTVIGGSQSGFDTQGLIDALTAARSQPATNLTTKNKTIDSQISAYSSLNSLLGAFKSAADVLRNPPGVQNASQNIFAYRTATASASNGIAASNYVNITAAPGASVQNFSIDEVQQLAQQTKQHTDVFTLADTTTASAVTASGVHTAGLFSAGTVTLKTIDGSGDASITLNENDSLQAVVNKFNAVSNHTGIQANILQITTGQYEITFTGTKTGAANGFDLRNAAGPANTVKTDADGVFSMISPSVVNTQGAQDSIFTIDGTDIQRSTNSISDALSGITFTLQHATPALTTIDVNINPDTTIVANAIQSFADAYNAFRLFASKQNERNADGTPKTDAVLANDSTLRSIISSVGSEVTKIVSGITGGDPSALSDVGISFTQFNGDDTNPATSNIMSISTDELNSALASNFTGVAALFQYQMSSDNANLSTFSRTNGLNVSSFTVTKVGSIFQASYTDPATGDPALVDLTATALSGGGFSLKTPTDSALAGLTLLYTSSSIADATIHVTTTQGIGDRLYNALDSMINTTSGTVTNAVKSLTAEENRNTDQITKINDQVALYRDQLTSKFAALESALTQANSLLALLNAQSNAQISASGH